MGATEYVAAVMADTPKAFFTMQDASGNPQDSSGNGLHITSATGSPTYQAAGPFGTDFSIELDYAEFFQRSTDVSTVTTDWTVELCWYPIDVGAAGRTIARLDQNGTASGWGIGTNGSVVDSKPAGHYGNIAKTAFVNLAPLFSWSHIAVLRRQLSPGVNQWEYYFNGQHDTYPVADSAPTAPAGITQINAGNFLKARYAYVAVYETSLPPHRITEHFNAGFGSFELESGQHVPFWG